MASCNKSQYDVNVVSVVIVVSVLTDYRNKWRRINNNNITF